MARGSSSSDDKATMRFYADKAETYVASGPGDASPHLHSFLKKLTPGAHYDETSSPSAPKLICCYRLGQSQLTLAWAP